MKARSIPWIGCLAVLIAVRAGGCAAAGDDQSVRAVRQFGLEGVWSPDCRQPASSTNPRVVWQVAPDGTVRHFVVLDGGALALADTLAETTIAYR